MSKGGVDRLERSCWHWHGIAQELNRVFLAVIGTLRVFTDAFLPLNELLLLDDTKIRHNGASKRLSTLLSLINIRSGSETLIFATRGGRMGIISLYPLLSDNSQRYQISIITNTVSSSGVPWPNFSVRASPGSL